MKRRDAANLSHFVRAAREDAPSMSELETLAASLQASIGAGVPSRTGLDASGASGKGHAATHETVNASGSVLSSSTKLVLMSLAVSSVVAVSAWFVLRSVQPEEKASPSRVRLAAPVSSVASSRAPEAAWEHDGEVSERPAEKPPTSRGAIEAHRVVDVDPAEPRGVRKVAIEVEDPRDEAALIDNARRELRSNPSQALELVRQHRRRFPRGLAKPEADAIEIEALARLGQLEKARTLLARFEERDPSSSHVWRLKKRLDQLNPTTSR